MTKSKFPSQGSSFHTRLGPFAASRSDRSVLEVRIFTNAHDVVPVDALSPRKIPRMPSFGISLRMQNAVECAGHMPPLLRITAAFPRTKETKRSTPDTLGETKCQSRPGLFEDRQLITSSFFLLRYLSSHCHHLGHSRGHQAIFPLYHPGRRPAGGQESRWGWTSDLSAMVVRRAVRKTTPNVVNKRHRENYGVHIPPLPSGLTDWP